MTAAPHILAQFKYDCAHCTPMPVVPDGNGGTRLAPITVEWFRHRLHLALPFGRNSANIDIDGMEVGAARNEAVRIARENKCKYLFFLDYDVLPPWNAYHKLVYLADQNPEYDVFAGVYCVKVDPPCPLIYRGFDGGPHWDWTLGDVLTDGITGVGMGCTLLRLSLFDRLPHSEETPWFKTKQLADLESKTPLTGQISEDLWFCARATGEASCRIMVDTGIQCGHIANDTGRLYVLPEDSLPVKRYNAREAPHA